MTSLFPFHLRKGTSRRVRAVTARWAFCRRTRRSTRPYLRFRIQHIASSNTSIADAPYLFCRETPYEDNSCAEYTYRAHPPSTRSLLGAASRSTNAITAAFLLRDRTLRVHVTPIEGMRRGCFSFYPRGLLAGLKHDRSSGVRPPRSCPERVCDLFGIAMTWFACILLAIGKRRSFVMYQRAPAQPGVHDLRPHEQREAVAITRRVRDGARGSSRAASNR